MSNQKVINLQKMWKEEGFRAEVLSLRSANGRAMEIMLSVKRQDGSRVAFQREWTRIKTLAKRQEYYALPVSEAAGQVLLVSNQLIKGRKLVMTRMLDRYRQTYWFCQNTQQTEYYGAELIAQAFFIEMIRTDANKLGKCKYAQYIQIYNELYNNYCLFKSKFILLTEDMQASGVLTAEDLEIQMKLLADYSKAD